MPPGAPSNCSTIFVPGTTPAPLMVAPGYNVPFVTAVTSRMLLLRGAGPRGGPRADRPRHGRAFGAAGRRKRHRAIGEIRKRLHIRERLGVAHVPRPEASASHQAH